MEAAPSRVSYVPHVGVHVASAVVPATMKPSTTSRAGLAARSWNATVGVSVAST